MSVLLEVLFLLGCGTLPQLIGRSEDDLRNLAISGLEQRCSTPVASLQALKTEELASALLVESVLARDPTGHQRLKDLSAEDQRNTLIVVNNKRLSIPIPTLQAKSSMENSRLAYQWLLPALAGRLMEGIGDLRSGSTTFQATALFPSSGKRVVLGVACVRFYDSRWIAVFHAESAEGPDLFDVYVATGSSAQSLKVTALLRKRASMGKFYLVGGGVGGVLLLCEQNGSGGPSVAASHYTSMDAFLAGLESRSFVSPQSLGAPAEGTPSLTAIDEAADELTLGMHYYKDGRIDQQAVAVLQGFLRGAEPKWQALPLSIVNDWLAQAGYAGKVGSRSYFNWNGKNWFIMEVQEVLNAWDSWRIVLGDGLGFVKVPIQMASKSCANPVLTTYSDSEGLAAVSTFFIPSEGSVPGEAGELMHAFQLPSGIVASEQPPTIAI